MKNIQNIRVTPTELEEVGAYRQKLFNYLSDLGVIALESEMQEIETIVLEMQQQDKNKYSEERLVDLDIEAAKELEQKHLRDNLERLVQEIKDYTRESRNILGFDDREPSEFVDIFLGKNEQKD
jgi:hypothetical protein